jgi:diguanylate cyclase (GGDEF)-like protein/PAS domain S-box-containing protein
VLFRSITDAVFTLDARLRLCYLNSSAERLVGHNVDQVQGRPVSQLLQLSQRDVQVLETALDECLSQRRVVLVHQPLRVHDGEAGHLVRLIANPVRHRPGDYQVPGHSRRPGSAAVVLALSDITAEVLANEQLRHETTHDGLTGLPNRLLLTDRLQHALTGLAPSARGLAVLFVDLDRFQRINDSLGHRKGDAVLQEVSRRLVGSCRAHDTVARWGGDEFVVLLEDVSSREAVAAQAARLIEAVAAPYSLDGMEVECACCVGIAMAPQDGHDAEGLIALADTAMYRGKAQGGRRFEFYASEMPAWTRE